MGSLARPRRVVPREPQRRLVPPTESVPVSAGGSPDDTQPQYAGTRPGGPARPRARGARASGASARRLPRSLEQTRRPPDWIFYEGPPTANGMPGAHHVEARVFKDVFPRFKTMKGHHVTRKAGWDCHGLPVELAVEKELGFTGKQDIEEYGIAEFNAKCRESVTRHTDAFAELTDRMGYWVDLDDAYRTMDPDYVESVWWSLKQIFDKGLLVQDYRVAPWCPRDQTGLSDHELAQGYETVVDPSVYVRFPLTSGPLAGAGVAAGVDDDPVDAGVQHRGRRAPRRHLRRRHRRQRAAGGRRAAAGQGAGRGLDGDRRDVHRPRDGALDLPAARSTSSTSRRRALRRARRVRDHRGRHRPGAPVPRLRRGRPKVCRAYGLPVVNPVRPDGTFEPERAAGRRGVLQEGRRGRWSPTCSDRGAALPAPPIRAQLPALLALPHGAALLRAAVLVHPHHRGQGRAAARERAHQLVPGDRQARPLRRLAEQQRRLGAVPQPLLGHPAADLALRARAT